MSNVIEKYVIENLNLNVPIIQIYWNNFRKWSPPLISPFPYSFCKENK